MTALAAVLAVATLVAMASNRGLPIAHITTLAGSVTLIGTSSNLVIAGLADERGVEMSMLPFAPVALPRCGRSRCSGSPRTSCSRSASARARARALHDFERDGSLRIIAARTREPLHETRLDPGETCFVSADDRTALARNPTVIVAASFGHASAELAASGGATLMVITGVLSPRSAANALQPRVLALLAGSIGLGAVVVSSGLADRIADAIAGLSDGRLVTLIVLAVVTTVLTNLVTNAATASILTPVAISVAHEAGFGMPVLVACLAAVCGVAYALS